MDFSVITSIVGYVIYASLALIALWGAFSVIMVWRRVGQSRFRGEQEQVDFLDAVDESLAGSDFDAILEYCRDDQRAMPQLVLLAVNNRSIGYNKVRTMVAERFQRDVLADLEYRLTWVYTVIKTAPMIGLLGTVVGMMGAFSTLASPDKQGLDPAVLAGDIMLALVTTACGLAIAIPLVLSTASINVRIRKLEDLVSTGLTRFLETFKRTSAQAPRAGGRS